MFLAIEEMRQSKLRYGLVLGLLVLIAYLVFFLTGLAYGLMQQNRTAVDKWQADSILLSSEANKLITASHLDMQLADEVSAKEKALLKQQAGAAWVKEDAGSDDKEKITIFAIEKGTFIEPDIVEGRLFEQAHEVVIDKTLGEKEGFEIGETVHLSVFDGPVTIVGYTENAAFGVAPVVYMDFDDLDTTTKIPGQDDVISISGVIVRGDVTSYPEDELEKLTVADFIEHLPGYQAQNLTFAFMIGFLVVIAAIVIAIFIYVLTTQKAPIFGLMKIHGLSNGFISASVVAQTFLLSSLGTLLGLSLTYLSSLALPSAVPFENNWFFYGGVSLALVVFALLGASFSVRSIFKVDPLQNLS
ncbi:FtsX-like permease family protein [Streptococcus cuniculi]|uniref:Putative hemin transport system permease protein HrtB n=1 Tax=Streptococcus cuniculi TaxID=1432788 RepID=A0A4Y9JD18_9STRE|nr:FtsX-like permease family protein [Streptococcus cuniculi]MBF0777269.1 FtsX-like permease family protein [Streptococcus cuniculi]TFU98873.1 FtsX-like permease family protein [Streptococcus cuniculi]